MNNSLYRITIFCFIIIPNIGFSSVDSIIYWDDNVKLEWNDFKGVPTVTNKHFAISMVGVQIDEIINDDSVIIDISTYFNCKESWVKDDSKEMKLLLQHEQGHFDLSEVYARMLRQIISSEQFTRLEYENRIDSIIRNSNRMCDKANAQYDSETDYSKNTKNQIKWNNFISYQLMEYSEYSETKVIIRFER